MRRAIWDRVWWRAFPYTTTTRDGFRMHGDTADLIQPYIYYFYFGEWEPVISTWFRQHVQHGDTVVDVGGQRRLVQPAGRTLGRTDRAGGLDRSFSLDRAGNTHDLDLNPTLSSRITALECAAGASRGTIPVYAADHRNIGQTSTVAGALTRGLCAGGAARRASSG